MSDRDRILSVRQCAEYLGVSEDTVRRLKNRGDLRHYTIGRMVKFRVGHIEEYLASCLSEPKGIEARQRSRDRVADLLGIVELRDYLPDGLRP